jgi:hypothetical protein
MKVKNHLDFRLFDYASGTSSQFETGDVVYKMADPVYDSEEELGVIIQVHGEHEFRTEMFGNCCSSEIRLATREEIARLRPHLLDELAHDLT